jgi:hypothetical protein
LSRNCCRWVLARRGLGGGGLANYLRQGGEMQWIYPLAPLAPVAPHRSPRSPRSRCSPRSRRSPRSPRSHRSPRSSRSMMLMMVCCGCVPVCITTPCYCCCYYYNGYLHCCVVCIAAECRLIDAADCKLLPLLLPTTAAAAAPHKILELRLRIGQSNICVYYRCNGCYCCCECGC